MTPSGEASGNRASVAASTGTTYGWLVIAIVSFVGFAGLTWLVAGKTNIWFDQPLLDPARSWTQLTPLWNFVSNAANYPMIGVGVGIVIWLLWKRRRREAVLVAVLLIVATAGSELVKEVVARPRPIKGPEIGVVYSYASGHTLEALTMLGIIALLTWRSDLPRPVRLGVPVLLGFLVVLVGVARVALGEHYPTDILGGALAGSGTLATFAFLTRGPVAASATEPARAQPRAWAAPSVSSDIRTIDEG